MSSRGETPEITKKIFDIVTSSEYFRQLSSQESDIYCADHFWALFEVWFKESDLQEAHAYITKEDGYGFWIRKGQTIYRGADHERLTVAGIRAWHAALLGGEGK